MTKYIVHTENGHEWPFHHRCVAIEYAVFLARQRRWKVWITIKQPKEG